MPDTTLRISRRTLIQAAGFAPLVALAASGATEAEVAMEAMKVAEIDNDVMDELIKKANPNDDPHFNHRKFAIVVSVMWRYFKVGADSAGLGVPKDKNKVKQLLFDAYAKPNNQGHGTPSGDLVASRLSTWELNEEVTNVCSFKCGQYTAQAALDSENPNKEIDKEAYKLGYNRTEREMIDVVERLRRMQAHKNVELYRGNGC